MSTYTFGQSKEDQEIMQLEKYWTELLDDGDTTALLQVWSKDYVVNNPNGKIVTPNEIISLLRSGHKFPKVERIIEEITFNQNYSNGKRASKASGYDLGSRKMDTKEIY